MVRATNLPSRELLNCLEALRRRRRVFGVSQLEPEGGEKVVGPREVRIRSFPSVGGRWVRDLRLEANSSTRSCHRRAELTRLGWQ